MSKPPEPEPNAAHPPADHKATDPNTHLPQPTRTRFAGPLLGAALLAALPATYLAYERVQYEQSQNALSMVMDYPALKSQADRYGVEALDLLAQYRELGIGGVGVYEDVVGNWESRGLIFVKSGADLLETYPDAAFNPAKYYLRGAGSDSAQALETLKTRFSIVPKEVTLAGQEWQEWNINPSFLPVGPDTALIDRLKSEGYSVVYRPYDDPSVLNLAADWPDVPFVAFNGTEVVGARDPERLKLVDTALEGKLPALIEATPQGGLSELVERHGAVRTFSMNAAWQEKLRPEETASKYALAGRERSHRLLYMRPYPTIAETETLLERTHALLQKAGKQVTALDVTDVQPFQPNAALQLLTMLGPLAALLLLGLSYPLPRLGLLAAGLAGAGALSLNAPDLFGGMALVAAITFPALGFVLWRSGMADWARATGLSVLGVLFVSALGANPQSMLGLEPFRGVGLTLLAPIALVLGSYLPRQDIRTTAAQLYRRPLTTGDLAVMGVALVAFAVMFLRRGNTSAVGVSDAEAKIRQELQDSIIRPRFKEVLGHPLALLGLGAGLPNYLPGLLLLGGVMGQASILNTFAHFHTPLLISATRMGLGILAGLTVGIVAVYAVRFGLRLWQSWGGGIGPEGGHNPESQPHSESQHSEVRA